MIVEFIWADCQYQDGSWSNKAKDAYFVGGTPQEIEELILPHVQSHKLQVFKDVLKKGGDSFSCGHGYFLLGYDLSFVDWHSPFYPVSHMWNGGSPFMAIDPAIELSNLEKLKELYKLLPERTKEFIRQDTEAAIANMKSIACEFPHDRQIQIDSKEAVKELEMRLERFK